MSKSERAVLEVLFPEVRAKLLRSFFTTPLQPRYVRELVNVSGLTLHTVQDELRKLSAVGLLTSWSNGYHRFYRANPDHPIYPKLVGIVQLSERLPRIKGSALERPGSDALRKCRSDANRDRCHPTAQRAGICSRNGIKLDGFKPSSLGVG